MNKYEYHLKLCNEFHEVYLAKNDDYGDAFSKLWAETGFIAGYTKIADKFYRIQSLRKKGEENRRVNETMRDSLMDLANYCMMCVMEMDLASGKIRISERPTKQPGKKKKIPDAQPKKCPNGLVWSECALDANEAAKTCGDCPFIVYVKGNE